MTIQLKMDGFDEADRQLSRVRITMREKVLKRAINRVMSVVVKEAATRVPAQGRTVGGIEYTERKGKRASRPPLAESLDKVMRTYRSGDVVVAVGGPKRGPQARHAHLVEKGFWHTTDGTFKGSGGKTRKSKKGKAYTGTGVRRAFIFPRPFLLYTFARMQPRLVQMVADEIRTYADKRKW